MEAAAKLSPDLSLAGDSNRSERKFMKSARTATT